MVEFGEPREVHHFACLAGYGAEAINPYLAFETIIAMKDRLPGALDDYEIVKRYIKSIGKGLLKVMSKMGISTYQLPSGPGSSRPPVSCRRARRTPSNPDPRRRWPARLPSRCPRRRRSTAIRATSRFRPSASGGTLLHLLGMHVRPVSGVERHGESLDGRCGSLRRASARFVRLGLW